MSSELTKLTVTLLGVTLSTPIPWVAAVGIGAVGIFGLCGAAAFSAAYAVHELAKTKRNGEQEKTKRARIKVFDNCD